VRVVRAGVGLTRNQATLSGLVVSVGLAGGLRPGVEPGTIVVPDEVGLGNVRYRCDERATAALVRAAHGLGVPLTREPLVTTATMVTGAARARYAARGFCAVDLESGALAASHGRIAVVRAILDTPERELSPRWRNPAMAMLDPRLWSQAMWLLRAAPAFARRAATVLASALADLDVDSQV